MKLSNALFVLPTLFTLTSMFLGLLSLVSSLEGDFRLAAMAIIFGVLFDSIDGRVARLTRTQSLFGIQIDSLADVVSFGAAPAVLVYQALLKGKLAWGPVDIGLLAAFLYLAAGAIRLARFNVVAERKPGPTKAFVGLPIPGGAGCLAGLVLGLNSEGTTIGAMPAALVTTLLAVLMVSTVSYRKKLDFKAVDTAVIVVLLALTMGIVSVVRPAFVAFSFFAYYVSIGLLEASFKVLQRNDLKRVVGKLRKKDRLDR
jgi:CDP-diacylglycerol--serine O-phosphatidyltransferase